MTIVCLETIDANDSENSYFIGFLPPQDSSIFATADDKPHLDVRLMSSGGNPGMSVNKSANAADSIWNGGTVSSKYAILNGPDEPTLNISYSQTGVALETDVTPSGPIQMKTFVATSFTSAAKLDGIGNFGDNDWLVTTTNQSIQETGLFCDTVVNNNGVEEKQINNDNSISISQNNFALFIPDSGLTTVADQTHKMVEGKEQPYTAIKQYPGKLIIEVADKANKEYTVTHTSSAACGGAMVLAEANNLPTALFDGAQVCGTNCPCTKM